jgi:hypothetical protein
VKPAKGFIKPQNPKLNMKALFVKSLVARALFSFTGRAKTASTITLALLGIAVSIIPSARATPQSGVTSLTIAQGAFENIDVFTKTDIDTGVATEYWKAMIRTKGASRLFVVQNTVVPGGSFGWHSHPGPTLVIVLSGTATEYHGDDPTSTPHAHPAGTTFVDEGEAAGHLVRNEGSVSLVVIAVRLFPDGVAPRIDLPNPGYNLNLN